MRSEGGSKDCFRRRSLLLGVVTERSREGAATSIETSGVSEGDRAIHLRTRSALEGSSHTTRESSASSEISDESSTPGAVELPGSRNGNDAHVRLSETLGLNTKGRDFLLIRSVLKPLADIRVPHSREPVSGNKLANRQPTHHHVEYVVEGQKTLEIRSCTAGVGASLRRPMRVLSRMTR